MASENGHNGDPQSDLAVMDANEYKQKRRLERLLDAIDNVQDTADEAWNAYVAGEISREARNITIQRTVQNAIRECYKLLLDHSRRVAAQAADAEQDPDAEPMDGRDRYWRGNPDDPLGTVELLGETEARIDGLEDFLKEGTFFDREVTKTVERRNMPDETVTRTAETTMPEEISYRAYLRLKEFLDDVHDMEISFEEMEDDDLPMITGFDMSDPESNGDGVAGSTDVHYNGSPDI